jgi:hypothetical protein
MTTTQTAARNVYTHTGMVHASRRHADGRLVPACMGNDKVQGLHFAAETDDAVTCSRCSAVPAGTSVEDKRARAAATRAARKRDALVRRAEQPARRLPAHVERVTFLAGVGTPAALEDLAGAVAAYAAIVADAREAAEQLAALDA